MDNILWALSIGTLLAIAAAVGALAVVNLVVAVTCRMEWDE